MNYLSGEGERIVLDPASLIQSGGEGMIFDLGQHAFKRWHHPGRQHAAKLAYMLRPEMRQRWPANVMAPQAAVRDEAGNLAGFLMARLPAAAYPFKKLASASFCQKLGLDAGAVLPLFQEVHSTLSALQRAGVVVGDLNDHNLFFTDPRRPPAGPAGSYTYWVDVDSFQCGPFPCPVGSHAFLEPSLYSVKDFGREPVFTPLTDWYAFFVLLLKGLLQVHPYGGAHHRHKSLASRAQARLTVFATDVIYPKNARPPAALSDELLAYAGQIFGQRQRERFPAGLLSAYAGSLRRCDRCRLAYPRERAACPACHQAAPVPPPHPAGRGGLRCLFKVEGVLQHVAVRPGGRIVAIARAGEQYRLLQAGPGGLLNTTPLFAGRAGYRFGYFGETVVVSNGESGRLLLLDVGGPTPRQMASLETGSFQGRPVFATTPAHLYRLVRGCLLKGAIRYGQYVDEVVATVHREQTRIWADPAGERVAGTYRTFDRHHFFIVDAGDRSYEVTSPHRPGREAKKPGSVREVSVCFGREAVAFLWQTARAGHLHTYGQLTSAQGEPLAHFRPEVDSLRGSLLSGHTLLTPADGAIRRQTAAGTDIFFRSPSLTAGERLLPHPAGLLICQSNAAYLLSTP